jgi:hypothetical protein
VSSPIAIAVVTGASVAVNREYPPNAKPVQNLGITFDMIKSFVESFIAIPFKLKLKLKIDLLRK